MKMAINIVLHRIWHIFDWLGLKRESEEGRESLHHAQMCADEGGDENMYY